MARLALIPWLAVAATFAMAPSVSAAGPVLAITYPNSTPIEGTAVSGVQATFTDAVADPASNFTASIDWGDGTLTAGTVNGSGGSYSVSGSHTYADEASITATIAISDADGSSVSGSSAVTVGEGDNGSLAGRTLTLGQNTPYSGPVASFTDVLAGQTASDWTATIDWGDGTTGPGDVTGGSGNFLIIGTHTYSSVGTYSLTASLSEDPPSPISNVAISGAVTVLVPFTMKANPLSATEAAAFSGLVASFTDNLGPDPLSNYSATISWGDGSSSAGTVTNNGSNYDISGGHVYADEGSFTVSVALSDNDGSSVSAIVAATVAEAGDVFVGTGKTITIAPGSMLSGPVATFSDSNAAQTASDLVAGIDWGDGTTSPGTVSGGGGSFAVNGSHTYSNLGTYTITASIGEDSSTARTTASSTAEVVVPITMSANALSASEATAFSGPVASFTDNLGPNPLSNYSATISWGDGSSSAGTVTNNGSSYDISGAHVYADEGSFAVSVALIDNDGSSSGAGLFATVAEGDVFIGTGKTITIAPGSMLSGAVATFSDSNAIQTASDLVAGIDWGDGTTSPGTVSGGGGSFAVNGSHTYGSLGTYTITASIAEHASPARTTVISIVQVVSPDQPLTITTIGGLVFGRLVAAGISFTDGDPLGSLPQYTATINWGDHTSSAGSIGRNRFGRGFVAGGLHKYAAPGTYVVSVTVADVQGATATRTTTVSVRAG